MPTSEGWSDILGLIGILGSSAIAASGDEPDNGMEPIYDKEEVRKFADQVYSAIWGQLQASQKPVEIISPGTPTQQSGFTGTSARTGGPIEIGGYGPDSPGYVAPQNGTNYMYEPPQNEALDAIAAAAPRVPGTGNSVYNPNLDGEKGQWRGNDTYQEPTGAFDGTPPPGSMRSGDNRYGGGSGSKGGSSSGLPFPRWGDGDDGDGDDKTVGEQAVSGSNPSVNVAENLIASIWKNGRY